MASKGRASPDRADQDEDAALRLWIRLVRLANGLQKDVDRRLRRDFGQSLARFDVLSQLYRVPDYALSVGELSSSLLTPTNNITRLIDRMQRDGLVARALNETDRRSVRIVATRRGVETFEAMARQNREWINRAFGDLSGARKQRLLSALQQINL